MGGEGLESAVTVAKGQLSNSSEKMPNLVSSTVFQHFHVEMQSHSNHSKYGEYITAKEAQSLSNMCIAFAVHLTSFLAAALLRFKDVLQVRGMGNSSGCYL